MKQYKNFDDIVMDKLDVYADYGKKTNWVISSDEFDDLFYLLHGISRCIKKMLQ